MRKLGIFSIIVAVLMLVSGSAIAQKPDSEPVITLERQACFGACPVYTITVYDDGTVVYDGQRFVEVEGEQTINIGAEAVQRLVDVFVEAGYFELEDTFERETSPFEWACTWLAGWLSASGGKMTVARLFS